MKVRINAVSYGRNIRILHLGVADQTA